MIFWFHAHLYLMKQQKMSEIIHKSLCKRMLHGHLKDGKYDNADESLRKETKNVSNTNNIG